MAATKFKVLFLDSDHPWILWKTAQPTHGSYMVPTPCLDSLAKPVWRCGRVGELGGREAQARRHAEVMEEGGPMESVAQ